MLVARHSVDLHDMASGTICTSIVIHGSFDELTTIRQTGLPRF
jgi:hypothetical protein